MNEQLKRMLLDAAQKGINGVENTIDWIAQQAPELLEQLVKYNLVSSGIWALISLIVFIVLIVLAERLWKNDEPEGCVFLIMFNTISFFVLLSQLDTFIKCVFAPKLFIFEYLSSLLK